MKQLRTRSGLVVGLFWLLIADVATAGDYALAVGKGIEVCEAYLTNLNSFPKHPPMVCERPLNPQFTDFSKPQWQPMEFWPNRHLLREAIRQHSSNQAFSDEEFEKRDPYDKWEAIMADRMMERVMSFGTVVLDVERDGEPETVLRFDTGFSCDPTDAFNFAHAGGVQLYVLTPDRQHVDAYKSKNFGLQWGRPELVLYQGRAYISRWTGGSDFKRGALWLESPANMQQMNRHVCKFLYKSHTQRRSS